MAQTLRHTGTFHEHLQDHRFNPHDYIATLLSRGDIQQRLNDSRHVAEHVRTLAVHGLKDSAFTYHTQMVKAIKELKTMDSGLDELRQLLLEEQGVLDRALQEPKSIVEEKKRKLTEMQRSRFVTRKSLSGLFNKIDGFDHTGLKDRVRLLVGSKDIRELDQPTLEKKRNMIAHLFTDCIILTLWTPHHEKHMYIQYTYVDVIYFDFIAGVEAFNVPLAKKHKFFEFHLGHKDRDPHPTKFPFLVTFHNDQPPRLFDVDNANERDEWMTYLREQTKLLQDDKSRSRRLSQIQSVVHDSLDDILERHRSSLQNMQPGNEEGLPTWYRDAAVDINDYCDTKEYEQAIDLLRQAHEYWQKQISWEDHKEGRYYYRKCLDAEERLIDHLFENFRFALNCPFGVDRVTCMEIIGHLRELNLLYQALLIFLDFRTWLLDQALDAAVADGTNEHYVKRKLDALATQLNETVTEMKEFGLDVHAKQRTAFVAWARHHLIRFCSDNHQFIFSPRLSFHNVQEIVQLLRQSVNVMGEKIGLDLSLQLEGCLTEPVGRWLDSWIELIGGRFHQQTQGKCWAVVTFDSDDDQRHFIEQCREEGLGDLSGFAHDGQLHLNGEVLHYAKEYLQLFDAVFSLCHQGMRRMAKKCLALAMAPVLEHLRALITAELPEECNMNLIKDSLSYLSGIFVPNVEAVFHGKYVGCDYFLFLEKETLEELLRQVSERLSTQFYKRSHIAL